MSDFQARGVFFEGRKTTVLNVLDNPRLCIVQSGDTLTNYNEWDESGSFGGKGVLATTISCRVFEFLSRHGVPVAYIQRHLLNSFVAKNCTIIPVVVAVRSHAVGSYLQRHESYIPDRGEMFHRFHEPIVEIFLKTSGMGLIYNGKRIIVGLTPQLGEANPLMQNAGLGKWELHAHRKDYPYDIRFHQSQIGLDDSKVSDIKRIAAQSFDLLVKAWQSLDCTLLDCRFEFGVAPSGKVVLVDVICNDSWHLLSKANEELSIFALGDSQPIALVQDNYQIVCALTEPSSHLDFQ